MGGKEEGREEEQRPYNELCFVSDEGIVLRCMVDVLDKYISNPPRALLNVVTAWCVKSKPLHKREGTRICVLAILQE